MSADLGHDLNDLIKWTARRMAIARRRCHRGVFRTCLREFGFALEQIGDSPRRHLGDELSVCVRLKP